MSRQYLYMLFRQIQRVSSHVGCAANVMPTVFIAESSSNPTGCMPGEREREEGSDLKRRKLPSLTLQFHTMMIAKRLLELSIYSSCDLSKVVNWRSVIVTLSVNFINVE